MATGSNAVKLAVRLGLAHELAEVYKPAIVRKKYRVIELIKDKAIKVKKSETARKMQTIKDYLKLEMAPPTTAEELTQLKDDINLVKEFLKSGCYKHLTVKQAWLLFLVGLEVSLWFYLGETIGKMHIVGYKVHV